MQRHASFSLLGQSVRKNGASRNEDAYSPPCPREAEGDAVMALADGATGAIFSGQWAELLVSRAVAEWKPVRDLTDEILIRNIRALAEAYRPEIPQGDWFVRNKFARIGSQATFLLAQVESAEDSPPEIHAVAVGDSCLLKVNQETWELLDSFPLKGAREFGSSPALVTNRIKDDLRFQRADWRLGEREILLLATDALAKWMLGILAAGKGKDELGRLVHCLKDAREFEKFVALRREGDLENDDTTLLACIPVSQELPGTK